MADNVTIPKLITDTDKYFQYEGSANPTTQDELQAYMKNEHSVVACLANKLWQPETNYTQGQIVESPNMPVGFYAVALVDGTSYSNEPDWGDGSKDISDGSMKWHLTKGNVTVNNVAPDDNGNIQIDSVSHANNADNATKATNDSAGNNINTTYVKNVSGNTNSLIITKGDGTTSTININPEIENKDFTVTASTQSDFNESYSTPLLSGGSNNSYALNIKFPNISTGITNGTYTLQDLLQQLVNKSHSHSNGGSGSYTRYNCNCNCSDSDCSCIIKGNILVNTGLVKIEELQVGQMILGKDKKYHKVIGIKHSKLGKRKAIQLFDNSAIYTDDHLFLMNNGEYKTYDIAGYYREASRDLTDGKVYGTYARLNQKEVQQLVDINVFNLPNDTVTYLPIVEDCEWILVDNRWVACARYLKDVD